MPSHGSRATIIISTMLREAGDTGVQTHLNTFKDYLQSTGFESKVVTPFSCSRHLAMLTFAPRAIIDRIHGGASVWWYRHWHQVFLRRALRRALAQGVAAIVYAQCPSSAKAALDVRSARHQRVFMAVHFNGSQADEWANQGKIVPGGRLHQAISRFESKVLPEMDGIIYVSKFMQRALVQRIPALAGIASAVIPNFCQGPSRPVDPAAASGLVSIGKLDPWKNQQFLLRVLAEAARQGKRYDLSLIGDGPFRVGLERLAGELGIAGQVRFLGFQPNAANMLPEFRVYVHASMGESFGISLIEAMAAGLPVLAPALGAVPEVFRDGAEGLYWQLDDPAMAATKLISVMENPDLWNRLSEASRSRHAAEFSTDVVAARLLQFLSAQAD